MTSNNKRKELFMRIRDSLNIIADAITEYAELPAERTRATSKKGQTPEGLSFTTEELQVFEEGIRQHGGDGQKIHLMLPNRQMKDINYMINLYERAGRITPSEEDQSRKKQKTVKSKEGEEEEAAAED